MATVSIGTPDEFEEGKGAAVELPNGTEIAVFNIDGEFYGILNRCPHKGSTFHDIGESVLNSEKLGGTRKGDIDCQTPSIYCPLHKLEFDLNSGFNPVTGFELPVYEVRVTNGEVVVTY